MDEEYDNEVDEKYEVDEFNFAPVVRCLVDN